MLQDELLKIVQNSTPQEYMNEIVRSGTGRLLYHLSDIRTNVVGWLPINRCHTILEIGSETGAITGQLAQMAESVTCVEVSESNNDINKIRNKKYDNITYITGKYNLIEGLFDYIILVSPIEDNQNSLNIAGQALIQYAKEHLNRTGKLVIATDNKYGLKYLAGNRDGYKGEYFSGMIGDSGYDKNSIMKMSRDVGFEEMKFYYPYPDYRLPLAIYSDEYLPKCGELTNNYRNFDNDRMYLFDESKAWDNVIRDGRFKELANSYIVVLQNTPICDRVDTQDTQELIFAKYSNDRAEEFNIRTDIVRRKSTDLFIHKKAIGEVSKAHIDSIYEKYSKLTEKYAATGVEFNRCDKDSEGVHLEYIIGKTLDEVIIEAINDRDYVKAKSQISRFCELLRYKSDNNIWDIDMIFKNIIVGDVQEDGTNKWTVIDYEWTFERKMPADFVIYRSLYYFIADNRREDVQALQLMEFAGITEDKQKEYEGYEKTFQQYASHDHISLGEVYPKVAGTVYDVHQILGEYRAREKQNEVTVYGITSKFDNDVGREQLQCDIDRVGETFAINIPVKDYKKLIINPGNCCCFVNVSKVSMNYKIKHNGIHINNGMYAFRGMNPEIELEIFPNGSKVLKVELMISNQGAETSSTFATLVNETELIKAKADGTKGIASFLYNKIAKRLVR